MDPSHNPGYLHILPQNPAVGREIKVPDARIADTKTRQTLVGSGPGDVIIPSTARNQRIAATSLPACQHRASTRFHPPFQLDFCDGFFGRDAGTEAPSE